MIAFTRAVSPSIGACELTHLERRPIDVDRAAAQHAAYERALEEAGCRVVAVAPAPELPDAVFVEDAAVVLDEVAILTRPGAASRRPEVASVARALADRRPLHRIREPGTLDGGDVLRAGRVVFVGVGGRTNEDGVRQLRTLLEPLGYVVRAVVTRGCLHLKTAVTEVAEGVLLLNPAWVDPEDFAGYRLVEVDPAEPFAANALRVGDVVILAAAHPATRVRLEAAGVTVRTVDVSELARAEAGVTCCSVLMEE